LANGHDIGVVCGGVSGGFNPRDFDTDTSYSKWSVQNGGRGLPVVVTGRGTCVWAKSKAPAKHIDYDDGELRGEAHYVVAPHSLHPNGTVYSWLVPLGEQIPQIDISAAGLDQCYTEAQEAQKRKSSVVSV
jgi:hypothetical protein